MLEFGPAMSPSGNTRPREHDANLNPWFLAFGLFHSLAKKRTNPLQLHPKMAKIDGANPSVASMNISVCNVPFWKHQSSALWVSSVPLRKHQASGA